MSGPWQTQAKGYKELSMGACSYEDLRDHLFAIADENNSDQMELGVEDCQAQATTKVSPVGQIKFPTELERMKDLLETLEQSIPNNKWLRNWLAEKHQEGQRKVGYRSG